MANAIVKISKRAKQISRASKNKAWKDCIAQASREYKAGKLGAVKKASTRQTGGSNTKRDKQRRAKPPGKRVSQTGNVYYERRKNRSDKPGKLSGPGGTFKSMADLKAANKAAGQFFFSPGTMKFFRSKIVTPLIMGKYFITSETFTASDGSSSTNYTIRQANQDARIVTVGQKHKTLSLAKAELRRLIK